MLINVLIVALVFFIFLFLFWRKLKEDYVANQIFTTALFITLGIVIAGVISYYFFSTWFWLVLAGCGLALVAGVRKFRMRLTEVVEAAMYSLVPVLATVYLVDFIYTSKYISLVGFALMVFLFILFNVFDKHYKKFTWYKSGRVGFSGLATLGLFFLIRALLATGFPDMLSFSRTGEVYLSLFAALACFLSVFYLSRKIS